MHDAYNPKKVHRKKAETLYFLGKKEKIMIRFMVIVDQSFCSFSVLYLFWYNPIIKLFFILLDFMCICLTLSVFTKCV